MTDKDDLYKPFGSEMDDNETGPIFPDITEHRYIPCNCTDKIYMLEERINKLERKIDLLNGLDG